MARAEGDEVLVVVLAGNVQVNQRLAGTWDRLRNELVFCADGNRCDDHTGLVVEDAELHE